MEFLDAQRCEVTWDRSGMAYGVHFRSNSGKYEPSRKNWGTRRTENGAAIETTYRANTGEEMILRNS